MSMPAVFLSHLMSKTVRNVCHCDIVEIRSVGKSDSFINKRIEFFLTKTIYLRPPTVHIMTCYIYKMAIVSWPYTL